MGNYAKEIKHLGRKTVVILYNINGEVVATGEANCNPEDKYNAELGESIATYRAEKFIDMQEDINEAVDDFNDVVDDIKDTYRDEENEFLEELGVR